MQSHLERRGVSQYSQAFCDPQAYHFTADFYPALRDPELDVSDTLQEAIFELKRERGFGVLYIPERIYYMTKTVYIPKAIRLIGYGENRPRFVLRPHSPGFQSPAPEDLGDAHYMFWFTNNMPAGPQEIADANPGTFYSAVSNLDFEIREGNPCAAVIRAHFAQHCFVSHCDFEIGEGKAGIVSVGNEMENLSFTGGDYGIITGKPSPGWPFLLADSTFRGQRRAAISSREGGLVLIRTEVSSCPTVLEVKDGYFEKLYLEDSRFDAISGPALLFGREKNAMTQVNLRNVVCRDTPVLAKLKESGREICPEGKVYRVRRFLNGLCIDSPEEEPELRTALESEEIDFWPDAAASDLPGLPAQKEWISVKSFGAVGDGKTDDTDALCQAAQSGKAVFFPQGFYRAADTVKMAEGTSFIGMNPVSTQLVLWDDTPAFSGFGTPKPLLETSSGFNLVNGIGLDTAGRNPRAVGCKWIAGRNSYMNDVKFVGGHGKMTRGVEFAPVYNESRTGDVDPDRLWSTQYWSLWIAENGGGVFKDIWSASSYAEAGIYLSDTAVPGRMYAVSVEHHVQSEVRLKKVSNWRFYALQTEEEVAESPECQPLELIDCENLLFVNLYTFRVVWVANPYPQAVLSWGSRNVELLNVHNYTQTPYTIDNTLLERDSGKAVLPWELARLMLPGTGTVKPACIQEVTKLADGFRFAGALCANKKGTVYFCDDLEIYSYEGETGKLRPAAKFPLKPLSLFCDSEDRLVVVAYRKLPKPEQHPYGEPVPEEARGSSYHWYMRDQAVGVYAIDPDAPEASMVVLKAGPAKTENPAAVYYPAHRWHDAHDFKEAVMYRYSSFYTAPDGKTLLADSFDLGRAVSLQAAVPGEFFYAVDEYDKRVLRMHVEKDGTLSRQEDFAEHGEFSAVRAGNSIFVADGHLYVFNEEGEELRKLSLPERPTCLLASAGGTYLAVTARGSLYAVKL